MLILLSGIGSSGSLVISAYEVNFNGTGTQSVTIKGGVGPYTAASSDSTIASVAQGTSPNLYPNADSLSGSTLTGLTLATGGPGGATDAEYTGTGSAAGANKSVVSAMIAVAAGSSYKFSSWFDPSQVTNLGSNVVQAGIEDINGLVASSSYVTSSTAGRYATSAWTCPTNLAPHSDDLSTWTNSGGALSTGGPGGATDWEYTGTGSASSQEFISAPAITVVPGTTYTFSGWVDPSQITAGTCFIGLYDTALGTLYASTTISSGTSGRFPVTWICPSNGSITQVRPLFDTSTCTVASGQKLKFSQPMLEARSSASGYYISSQNPQVQVFAQLLSSAIVTSGQKFKISQPMFALSTYEPQTYLSPTAVWNITSHRVGKATITYTDSTP